MAKRAFTLVELLVVIAIIGILIALLLPAINAAREAGRRAQCVNNLKQWSLAVLNYESNYNTYPAGCTFQGGAANCDTPADGMDNWVIFVLPFTEHNEIYKQINHLKPLSDVSNQAARGMVIPEMLCPSDAGHNRVPFQPWLGQQTGSQGNSPWGWARGNYAANGGLGFLDPGTDWYDAGGAGSPAWLNPLLRGVLGCNCALTTQKITDGQAHTVMLGETRAGLTPYDLRGVWAESGGAGSGIWGVGSFVGDDYGPNCKEPFADDCQNCLQMANEFGGGNDSQSSNGADTLISLGMPCSEDNSGGWPDWQQTMRSMHLGGVNLSMADGSVHFCSDLIECSPHTQVTGNGYDPKSAWPAKPTTFVPTVWDMLIASGDSQLAEQFGQLRTQNGLPPGTIPNNWDQ